MSKKTFPSEVVARCRELDQELRAGDPALGVVVIVCDDSIDLDHGSCFRIVDAKVVREGGFIYVPTEHYGCLVFESAHVAHCLEYTYEVWGATAEKPLSWNPPR